MNENNDIAKLFEGVTPERSNEILDLIKTHSAQFRRVGDKKGFNLDAGAYGAIQFTQRSLEQIWLFGFAGLFSLHCYSGALVLAQCYNLEFDLEEIDQLPDQRKENIQFSNVIKTIEELNNSESEHDFFWPIEIPKPENGRPKSDEQAAVFDLILMATGYVFLHELKHVIFESEGNSPQDLHEEEMQCDAFASNMILSKVEEYSATSGYPADKVHMKRSMGIALGCAFLAIVTPKQNLSGTPTHPPVYKRWLATLGSIDLPQNDYYWLYFASLAIASMRHKKITLPVQTVTSYKQLSISLIEALGRSL